MSGGAIFNTTCVLIGPQSIQSTFLTEVKVFPSLISQQIILISVLKWIFFFPSHLYFEYWKRCQELFEWAQFGPLLQHSFCMAAWSVNGKKSQLVIRCSPRNMTSQLSSPLDSLSHRITQAGNLFRYVSSLQSMYLHYSSLSWFLLRPFICISPLQTQIAKFFLILSKKVC